MASANYYCGFGPERGIYVIGDRNDTWVPARQIWNQHSYHVTNVNDDGTIPRFEQNSWQTHNTYRLNLPRQTKVSIRRRTSLLPLFEWIHRGTVPTLRFESEMRENYSLLRVSRSLFIPALPVRRIFAGL